MFLMQMCVYSFFLGTITYSKSSKISNESQTHIFRTFQSNRTQNTDISKKLQILLQTKDARSRHRRGIVLIDDDFDKVPDVDVRQSWSDGNIESVTEITTNKETEKDIFNEEGSGVSSPYHSSISDLFDSTFQLTDTPSKLQRTKETPKSTLPVDHTLEGSGNDEFISETTTNVEIPQTDSSTIKYCLNVTCGDRELTILPGFTETVPEDTSLILLCSTSNPNNGNLLQWYRSNDSESLLLETSNSKNELKLVLEQTKTQDSGMYMCVRLSSQSCCHRKLDITIYRKPNYKYHLLTVGLVAAVSLFTCLLLGIHRRYKVKQYKKESKTQMPLNEFLL